MLKLHFLHTISHNSNIYQSVLIILRELLNIIKHIQKHRWVIKYTNDVQ